MRFGGITFDAQETDGALCLSNMEGEGTPEDMLAVIRAIQEAAKNGKVYLSVDIESPRKEQIMRVYERFGAKPIAILMEVK